VFHKKKKVDKNWVNVDFMLLIDIFFVNFNQLQYNLSTT